MSAHTADKLVYMANQIARNFEAMGDEAAAVATADHMIAYWDPRMKEQIALCERSNPSGLSLIAGAALKTMAARKSTAASRPLPDLGASDAG